MQKLAEICIRRPVFAAMIVLSLVVVGAASYFKLGVDRFPAVDLPTVIVRTSLPGASPEEMETLVSQRIEEVVNTVEGFDSHCHFQTQPGHRHGGAGRARPGGDSSPRSPARCQTAGHL